MGYSNHAKKQGQRRGISEDFSELIMGYGDEYKSGGHCRNIRIPRRAMKELAEENPILWKKFRDKHRATAVVSCDGDVRTLKHHFGRLMVKRTQNDRR